MATLRLKHNPSHLPEDELIRSFVVRQRDLEVVLETVRENTGASNQHLLVLGPRGMGKTTLVNRAMAEIRRDPELATAWHPVLFDEESYTVTSAAELWFQALAHLADQTGDPGLQQARRALQTLTDLQRLSDASLARLREFATLRGKRLILALENVDMLFEDQMSDDDAWAVRHVLQNEPHIMVLATSTTRLDSFHHQDKALYELFREHTLERLDLEECRAVWRMVTGNELPANQARPIQIFTGGNTRLLTILAGFARDRSFRELMDDLVGLIDENTPYFKHNIEALPPESRKIFVTLADLWSPASTRQVAEQTRGDVRAVSAQLGRLERQGVVEVVRRVDRTQMFQVAERMYNLYHLLRRRGAPRVRAVVDFMVGYYDHDELQRVLASLAEEAGGPGLARRDDLVRAYCEVLRRLPDRVQREEALRRAPSGFSEIPDVADLRRTLTPESPQGSLPESELRARLAETPDDPELLMLSAHAYKAQELLEPALGAAERALALAPESERAARTLVAVVHGRPPGTIIEPLRRALHVARGEGRRPIHIVLASALAVTGRVDEAREMANEALACWPGDAEATCGVGILFAQMGADVAAVEAFTHSLELDPTFHVSTLQLADLLARRGRVDEAEERLRANLARNPRASTLRARLSALLYAHRKDPAAALRTLQEGLALVPEDAVLLEAEADVLFQLERWGDAEGRYRGLVRGGAHPAVWPRLVLTLTMQGKLAEAVRFLRELQGEATRAEWQVAAAELCSVEGANVHTLVQLRRASRSAAPDSQWLLYAGIRQLSLKDVTGLRVTVERIGAETWLLLFIYAVLEHTMVPLYPDAVRWAERVHRARRFGALASALRLRLYAVSGAWDAFWVCLSEVVEDRESVAAGVPDIIRAVMVAAACGHAARAVEVLLASPSAGLFEPLLVALRTVVGESTDPPQEVREVAEDIIRDITRMQAPDAAEAVAPAKSLHATRRRARRRACPSLSAPAGSSRS
jgi:tetratricopeptide (TPR) repeat protein/DNA-binding transcriptional ArsR family regulator